jgi:hypothetical protein
MDLTTGWGTSKEGEEGNEEHHYRRRGESHLHVRGLRRIAQKWPQGQEVVVYRLFGSDITEAEAADLCRRVKE